MDYTEINNSLNDPQSNIKLNGKRPRTLISKPTHSLEDFRKIEKIFNCLEVDNEAVEIILSKNFAFLSSVKTSYNCFNDALAAGKPKNIKKSRNKLYEKVENEMYLIEAYYILGIAEKSDYISRKSLKDKFGLLRAFCSIHENDYISFKELNSQILPLFGKKLKREVIGMERKNRSIRVASDINPIFRAVSRAKFDPPKSSVDNTNAFRNFCNNLKKTPVNKIEEYDLLNNSRLFSVVKSSKNIKKIIPKIEELLSKKGIPVEVANQMNYADFYDVIEENSNKDVTNFAFFEKKLELSPYQQLCKSISENQMMMSKIVQDMKKNNVSQEYIDLWTKSMREDYNHNPSTIDLPEGCNIPHKISIHHKKKIQNAGQFADPAMVNDVSNLAICMEFLENDETHEMEHAGDNVRNVYYKENSVYNKERPKDGDLIIAESLIDIDPEKNLPTNACYFSKTCILVSDNIKGCNDLEINQENSRPQKVRQ